jgi:osmoprotectant transport system ATP-binding protein
MDEPFGALDDITRAHMQDELLRIQKNVHKTILIVTHDMDEAFKLGDQIAVLNDGKLVQLGTPVDLLTSPANAFVSQLVGAENVLRQLEYLSVSDALAAEPPPADAVRQGLPTCAPQASLLTAMLKLIDSSAPALAVPDHDAASTRYVTLASIAAEVTRRHKSKRPDEARP